MDNYSSSTTQVQDVTIESMCAAVRDKLKGNVEAIKLVIAIIDPNQSSIELIASYDKSMKEKEKAVTTARAAFDKEVKKVAKQQSKDAEKEKKFRSTVPESPIVTWMTDLRSRIMIIDELTAMNQIVLSLGKVPQPYGCRTWSFPCLVSSDTTSAEMLYKVFMFGSFSALVDPPHTSHSYPVDRHIDVEDAASDRTKSCYVRQLHFGI